VSNVTTKEQTLVELYFSSMEKVWEEWHYFQG